MVDKQKWPGLARIQKCQPFHLVRAKMWSTRLGTKSPNFEPEPEPKLVPALIGWHHSSHLSCSRRSRKIRKFSDDDIWRKRIYFLKCDNFWERWLFFNFFLSLQIFFNSFFTSEILKWNKEITSLKIQFSWILKGPLGLNWWNNMINSLLLIKFFTSN